MFGSKKQPSAAQFNAAVRVAVAAEMRHWHITLNKEGQSRMRRDGDPLVQVAEVTAPDGTRTGYMAPGYDGPVAQAQICAAALAAGNHVAASSYDAAIRAQNATIVELNDQVLQIQLRLAKQDQAAARLLKGIHAEAKKKARRS